MDDRLQRRLGNADPLVAEPGVVPDTARLDSIKERIVLNQPAAPEPAKPQRRPSRRLAGIGVAALAVCALVVATAVLRADPTMAWSATPVAVTAAQRTSAEQACRVSLTPPAGAIVEQHGSGPAPESPGSVPPLVSVELHGDGAVAVLADAHATAYCLLKRDGDGFTRIALVQSADAGEAGFAIGGSDPGQQSMTIGGDVTGSLDGAGQLRAVGLSASDGKRALGIIGGSATGDAARIQVSGGAADGATATISDGRFALWVPAAMGDHAITLTAEDANGHDLGSVILFGAPQGPVERQTFTAP
jgi:hypothetical protein